MTVAKNKPSGSGSGSMGIAIPQISKPAPAPAPAAAPAPAPAPVKIEQWSPAKDDAYANAVASGDMATAARLVAERDALVAANDAFHKANGTGPYAGTGGAGGGGADAVDDTANRQAASLWLTNILKQYGIDGLASSVSSLVQQWGTNTDVIALKLKDTQQYKDRFKGLLNLQAKGITDITNEADYIQQETAYRQVFRDAGIQSYIGPAGSTQERDAIAQLVSDYSVSVDEVKSRVADAQRVVNETAPEVRDALKRYYNVSAADLVAYTLDPTRTKDRINQIANTAMVGGYAAQRGLNADMATAEQIAGLSQTGDMQVQPLVQQLGQAQQVADATKRLANIESTDLADSEILKSEFDLDQNASKKIKDLQSRERARFAGSSSMGKGSLARTTGS